MNERALDFNSTLCILSTAQDVLFAGGSRWLLLSRLVYCTYIPRQLPTKHRMKLSWVTVFPVLQFIFEITTE